MDKYFFSIPVYRFSEKDFNKKVADGRSKSFVLEHIGADFTFFDLRYGYSWKYNEIVGWFRLYFHFASLQVDTVFYEHKRKFWQIRLFKKNFIIQNRLTELLIDIEEDSNTITEGIIESISEVKASHPEYKKYYIDFSEFRQVGYALNWAIVRKSSNPIDGF